MPAGALESWRAIDEERREAITQMEAARAERNSLSQKIGAKRKAKRGFLRRGAALSKEIAARISSFEETLKALDERFAPIEETLPNIPQDDVPDGDGRDAERRPEDVGRADALRLPAARALGSRAGARHPRLRARGQDHRARASRCSRGRPRFCRARSSSSARRPHARARLHRGAASLHRELALALRHRPAPEVRGGSLSPRGDGLVPDAHGRGARHEPPPRRDAFPEGAARSPTARTRRASAPRRAPRARTRAA